MTVQIKLESRLCIQAEFNYSPGRDAPMCSNPDSPAYSDPGDPEECECAALFVQELDEEGNVEDEKDITEDQLVAFMGQVFVDRMYDKVREDAREEGHREALRHEAELEDWEDRRLHRIRRYQGEY